MVQTLAYSKEELAGSHLVLHDISWETGSALKERKEEI